MTEDRSMEEKLAALNVALSGDFSSAMDVNTDIVQATKTQVHNLLTIRNAHLVEADRLFEMVKTLAESAAITAEMNAALIATEFGILIDADDEEAEGDD